MYIYNQNILLSRETQLSTRTVRTAFYYIGESIDLCGVRDDFARSRRTAASIRAVIRNTEQSNMSTCPEFSVRRARREDLNDVLDMIQVSAS